MKNRITFEWFMAALIRAARTIAQVAVSLITVGAAMKDIDWVNIFSVAFVAGVVSILTSIATGLPESNIDGELQVMTGEDKDVYRFNYNKDLDELSKKKRLVFTVNQNPQK